ncbi:MAG: M1 family metallopeptidase [Flavobacteriaceae bacterium]|nr:M1 family metallopeptidase [Flavobacteriaceae bacterium]
MKNLFSFLIILLALKNHAQQTDFVDFKHAAAEINIEPDQGSVEGQVIYTFDLLQDTDSIFLDARNMTIERVRLNGRLVNFEYDSMRLIIRQSLNKNKNNSIGIAFKTQPKQAMYFVGWNDDAPNQVWTQGQGKYTSHWLPSIDDMNDKIEFDLMINAPSEYEVIANGKLIRSQNSEIGLRSWFYDMRDPMSSYLLAIVVGKYNKKVVKSESGVPLEMYYYPQDSMKFEPTYRYSRAMFDFLEREIGVSYPWQNYKQIPVHDFLYAGMENTGTTIFSDSFVIDSIGFTDNSYVHVNAHELAHQWFGNLVTEVSGKHHWLQEGFATYYALLAERHLFGNNHFYWKLYESAQQLNQQDINGGSTALLDPNSSSLTFYQKGAWTLYMLRELVGDYAFQTGIINYLEKYAFKNVSTGDFIYEIERVSEQDLTAFTDVWLKQVEFPMERAMDALKHNSTFIQEYLMVDCEVETSKCKDYLLSGISDEAKSKVIAQDPSKITAEVFRSSTKVRQAIAMHLKKIPSDLKSEYETLLKDPSYITIENALFNLWNNFKVGRVEYLKQTEHIHGLHHKNVRLLWLLLAIVTPEFNPDLKESYKNELIDYTAPSYNFELRMNAFQYLEMLKSCNEACLKNLEEAKTHHNWQMVKFAKALLDKTKN